MGHAVIILQDTPEGLRVSHHTHGEPLDRESPAHQALAHLMATMDKLAPRVDVPDVQDVEPKLEAEPTASPLYLPRPQAIQIVRS